MKVIRIAPDWVEEIEISCGGRGLVLPKSGSRGLLKSGKQLNRKTINVQDNHFNKCNITVKTSIQF